MNGTVNIYEAKTHFSKLLARVCTGEEIIIAKSGKPIARLVPIEEKVMVRKPGSAKGQISMGDNFDAPLPDDMLDAFVG